MKIKSISSNNFAGYDKISVSFDEKITYLVGKNGAGKSTLGLSLPWFLFQGLALKETGGALPLYGERFRFIGENGATSTNHMVLIDELHKNAEIKVTRKLTKTGTELSFQAPNDYPHTLNQDWLNSLFNIFLIAPKKFLELNGMQQAKALGIDTSQYDAAMVKLKNEYTTLNAVFKSYGEIAVVEKVEKVNVEELQQKKVKLENDLMEQMKKNKSANKVINDAYDLACQKKQVENQQFNKEQDDLAQNVSMAGDWSEGLGNMGCPTTEIDKWINLKREEIKPEKKLNEGYPPKPCFEEDIETIAPEHRGKYIASLIKEVPDKTELIALEKEINDAHQTNMNALLYTQYQEKVKQRDEKAAQMKANKLSQTDADVQKIEYIKQFKFPFKNLSVDDDGNLLLGGKPITDAYFSTGELLKVIPILISTTKPELKYVFIQGFNDLDEDNWKTIEKHLTDKGFQLVVEVVGKEKVIDAKSILLRDNVVVDSYDEEEGEDLEA